MIRGDLEKRKEEEERKRDRGGRRESISPTLRRLWEGGTIGGKKGSHSGGLSVSCRCEERSK